MIDGAPFYNSQNMYLTAPLWQQAIDWLREKHQVYIEIKLVTAHDYSTEILGEGMELLNKIIKFSKEEYNEAREAAITKALELIK